MFGIWSLSKSFFNKATNKWLLVTFFSNLVNISNYLLNGESLFVPKERSEEELGGIREQESSETSAPSLADWLANERVKVLLGKDKSFMFK